MVKGGYFIEDQEVSYTAEDIRFTTRDDNLYAICLGIPEGPFRSRRYEHCMKAKSTRSRCSASMANLIGSFQRRPNDHSACRTTIGERGSV